MSGRINQLVIFIIVTFVAFIGAYGLGLVIVNTVDNRLSDISINMPMITLPQNHISLKLADGMANVIEHGQTNYKITPSTENIKPLKQTGGANPASVMKIGIPPITSPVAKERSCMRPIDVYNHQFNSSQFKSESKKIDHPQIDVPTDTRNTESYPASYPTTTQGYRTTLSHKQLVPTYYRNPKDMTAAQILRFKTKANLGKMTVEDYENWLMLFTQHLNDLEKRHRDKLRILLKGGRLTVLDLPDGKEPSPPLSAEAMFNAKYLVTNSPAPDTTGPQYAYNFDDFGAYSQPNNLKHMATYNPDEIIKEDDEHAADIITRPAVTSHAEGVISS